MTLDRFGVCDRIYSPELYQLQPHESEPHQCKQVSLGAVRCIRKDLTQLQVNCYMPIILLLQAEYQPVFVKNQVEESKMSGIRSRLSGNFYILNPGKLVPRDDEVTRAHCSYLVR